jgi:hypothetical protein
VNIFISDVRYQHRRAALSALLALVCLDRHRCRDSPQQLIILIFMLCIHLNPRGNNFAAQNF